MWRHILNTPSPSSHIVTKCLTPLPPGAWRHLWTAPYVQDRSQLKSAPWDSGQMSSFNLRSLKSNALWTTLIWQLTFAQIVCRPYLKDESHDLNMTLRQLVSNLLTSTEMPPKVAPFDGLHMSFWLQWWSQQTQHSKLPSQSRNYFTIFKVKFQKHPPNST